MICRKCGKKIEENRLFCSECGTAAQIVPEYNKVDDELQKSLEHLRKDAGEKVSDESRETGEAVGTQSLKIPSVTRSDTRSFLRQDVVSSPKPDRQEPDREEEEEDWEEFSLEKKDTAKQKKRKLIAAIAALGTAVVVSIVVIIVLIVSAVTKDSYKEQMDAAQADWKKSMYEEAISSFENAIEHAKDENQRSKALSGLAQLYVEYGDENSAIYYYEEAAQLGTLGNDDVGTLVGLYENKADITAIRKLAEMYSNDETQSLFEKHLLNQPVFNYKSGTYNELLTVEITAAENEQIFYTLDNSEATPQSTPYTEPIQIGEGTTVVHAVALNSNGLLSDEIVTTYEVELDIPPVPVITPDTGSYTEPSKISFQNVPTNCTAYYTIDGTTPTADSIKYTEPFDMMLGNYVITAVYINNYTGQSGRTTVKIYDFSVNGKILWAEASGRVMNRLQETGEVLDGNGTMENGEICTLLPVTICDIGDNKYYIVKRYKDTSAGLREQGTAYAVDVDTGVVFHAEDNGNGQYNLSGF